MALTDNGSYCSRLTVGKDGIRLDADDVIIHLVTHHIVRGDIHQLDGLRHNQMGGHVLVDIDSAQIGVLCADTAGTQGYESHCC